MTASLASPAPAPLVRWWRPSTWLAQPVVKYIVLPCWWKAGQWLVWIAALALLAQTVSITWVQTEFATWSKDIYDATIAKNSEALRRLVLYALFLSVLLSVVGVATLLVTNWLTFRWRALATEHVLTLWLRDRNYYHLERARSVDNPDQRIESDIRAFIEQTLNLFLISFGNIASAATFSVLLWQTAGSTTLSVGDWQTTVPGYMFWLAWAWAIVQTLAVHLTGRALVGATFENERANAEFRYGLTLIRQSAEEIALYRGEAQERSRLAALFDDVRRRWFTFTRVAARSLFTNSIFGQIGTTLPTILVIPAILNGTMDYGQSIEVTTQFLQLLGALLWLANSYAMWAGWAGMGRRLTEMLRQLQARTDKAPGIARHEGGHGLQLREVSLSLPQGTHLVGPLNLSLRPGDRCLVTGPSGSGKSSLLRAIAGLWTQGAGAITLPEHARILFLPQDTYLPPGRLKDVVCYPGTAQQFSDEACHAVLRTCLLGPLCYELLREDDWRNRLSPGEKQRLAFARALLQAPELLFMDETTSAVDEPTEAALYSALIRELPQCVVVSVGHRSTLLAFHNCRLAVGVPAL